METTSPRAPVDIGTSVCVVPDSRAIETDVLTTDMSTRGVLAVDGGADHVYVVISTVDQAHALLEAAQRILAAFDGGEPDGRPVACRPRPRTPRPLAVAAS